MEIDPISWSEAAQRTGPFFFAILYAVVLTAWAGNKWREARQDPNADEADRRTYRLYFVFNASFGALAVVLASILWIQRQPPPMTSYTLRGSIRNLRSGQDLWSEDLFFRRHFGPLTQVGDKFDQPFDVTFFAEQNLPFAPQTPFRVQFKKAGAEAWEPIVAVLESGREYSVRYDPATDANVIVPTDPPPRPAPARSWFPRIIDVAWAAQLQLAPQSAVRAPIAATAAVRDDLTRALQSRRLYTGAQIDALDKLARFSKSDRVAFIESEGPLEPMSVTLLDLTRHEDDELSYKAKTLLKGVDIERLFRNKLFDSKVGPTYRDALSRLERTRVTTITNPDTFSLPQLSQIDRRNTGLPGSSILGQASASVSGKTPRLLSASSAMSGDHFWITSDGKNATCTMYALARVPDLFIDQAHNVARSNSKRAILTAANSIEKCGGKPSFARPFNTLLSTVPD